MSTHELFQLCCCQFGGTRTLRILPKKYHHFAKANLRKHLQSHLSHQWPKLRQLLGKMVIGFDWFCLRKFQNSWTFRPFNILFYICCILPSTILTCDAKSTYCTCSPKTCEKECRRHMLTRTKSRSAPTAACILEASQGGTWWNRGTVSGWMIFHAAKNQDTKP